MSSMNYQFHATINELQEIIQLVLTQSNDAEIMAVRYAPFRVVLVDRASVYSILRDETVARVVFTRGSANPFALGNLELLDANPGALVLDVGRESSGRMCESRLSATSARSAWKSATKALYLHTVAGVSGTNELSGARAIYRSHRLSPGAVARFNAGVKLTQFPTSPVFFEPLPSSPTVA